MKKNFILGIILIILIALAYSYQGPFKRWQAGKGAPENFLAKVEAGEIDKIEIEKDSQATILKRDGERWKVEGAGDFYVEERAASTLIQSLEQAVKAELELVSANQDNKKEFQTDESGIKVTLYQGGDVLADFIIGKPGRDFASAYISLSDINETYLIGVNLNTPFNQSEWGDRKIFSSAQDKISKLRLQYPNREIIIEKKDEGWVGTAPYKFNVDEEKVEPILDIMSNLTAARIPEQKFEGTGLEKHLIIVQVTGEGIDNTLMIGEETEDEFFYAKTGDSDNIYLITKGQRDELDRQVGEFK